MTTTPESSGDLIMASFMSMDEFVNIGAPRRITIERLTEEVFSDVDLAQDHFLEWLKEDTPRAGLGKGAYMNKCFDESVALSALSGNVTNGTVYYIGFGSGLWPYACAKLTGKKVVAIDQSGMPQKYAHLISYRFDHLSNLEYRQMALRDLEGEVGPEDILFVCGCEIELRDKIARSAKKWGTQAHFSFRGRYDRDVFSQRPMVIGEVESYVNDMMDIPGTVHYSAKSECFDRNSRILVIHGSF